MLDEREIEIEIARLEYAESSYPNYAKLADLYTIRNQMNQDDTREITFSAQQASDTVGSYGDSEFLQAVSGADAAAVWAVMDELMSTLQMVNERVYNRVLKKIVDI